MPIRPTHARALCAAALALVLLPSLADAQQPTRRRQAPITIRGTVPTPQVVTVRPREVPTYGRNILVPNFYDRDFWAVILPGYLVVPERMVTGESPLGAAADSAATAMPVGAAAAATDSAGAALSLPPLPPRPSRPFTRPMRTAPAGTQDAPARPAPPPATPSGGTPPSGASATGASGTAPASPDR